MTSAAAVAVGTAPPDEADDGDGAGDAVVEGATGRRGLDTMGVTPPATASGDGRTPGAGAAVAARGATVPLPPRAPSPPVSRGAGGAGASTGAVTGTGPGATATLLGAATTTVGDVGGERSRPSPLVRADKTSAAYLSVLAAATMPGDRGAMRGEDGGVAVGEGAAATAATAACADTLGPGFGEPKSACSCARW